MLNIRKIFCLALAAFLIMSCTGCKKNKDKDLSSSEISSSKSMPEYSVSQSEDGKEVVVDKEGKVVENAKITDDGAIEITDKKTGKTIKTIPKNEVKKYEEVSSKETTSVDSKTTDSSVSGSETTAPSGNSQSGSKNNNTSDSNNKPTPSTSQEETTTPSQPSQQPSQPTTSTPSENPSTTDTSVMTQAELNSVAEYFFQLVNQERARVGVQPLTRKAELDGAAKTRVEETFTVLGHTRPDGRNFSSILTDIKYGTPVENITSSDGVNWVKTIIYDYGVSGENLARIGNTDKQVCNGLAERFFVNLKNSKGHYQNMIDLDFNYTGVAVLEKYENNMHIYNIIQVFTSK